MTTTTRPLGAIATILDNDSLLAAGRRHFEAQYPGNDPQHLQHGPTPQMLFCTGHGALFRPADGVCVAGPCEGEGLSPWPVEVRDGAVVVA